MSRISQRMVKLEARKSPKRTVVVVAPFLTNYKPDEGALERHYAEHPDDRDGAEVLFIYSAIPGRGEATH